MQEAKSIVKPEDYDLDEKRAAEIQASFGPMIVERKLLAKEYEIVRKLPVDADVCERAGTLRKAFVKVRTGIAAIHKTQKQFFWQAGRFVDAWKNAATLPVSQMEEKLSEIEKHFENAELLRIDKIRNARAEELWKYPDANGEIHVPEGLGVMEDAVWENYIAGVRAAYQQRKEAERKAEKDRIAKEKKEAEERERVRVENEQLKKEAEAARKKEEAAEAKRKSEAKERERLEKARLASEAKARKKIEAAAAKERETAEAKLESERIAATAKLVAERTERERLESAEKIRVDMERKERDEKEAREKDKTHRSAVDVTAIDAMMAVGGSGVSQGACVLIFQAIAKGDIPNVSVNY